MLGNLCENTVLIIMFDAMLKVHSMFDPMFNAAACPIHEHQTAEATDAVDHTAAEGGDWY